jgi:hypothetical protein
MTLHRYTPAVAWVFDNCVVTALAHETAAVTEEVLEDVASLHATCPCGTTATREAAESRR